MKILPDRIALWRIDKPMDSEDLTDRLLVSDPYTAGLQVPRKTLEETLLILVFIGGIFADY